MQSKAKNRSPFHAGEQQVQERLGVREVIEPWARQVVRRELPEEHRLFYSALPFLVVAARDASGRPWATIVAGQPGFASSPEPGRLEIGSLPGKGDGLEGALGPSADVGLLGIDLASRRRNRANGRVEAVLRDGLMLEIDQNFGNCPQYITEREWELNPVTSDSHLPSRSDRLSDDHILRIRAADTFFIGTGHRAIGTDERFGMDASHRGGAPGFVEVVGDRTLLVPDYAGNNHYNTIGNLVMDPRAGLVFPDFGSGGLLQLTGRAEIDWDSDAVERFPEARRLIRFTVEEVRWRERALPIRWKAASGPVRTLRVVDKVRESEDVASFLLKPSDGGTIETFKAGQHLPIEVGIEDHEAPVGRTYSISNAPGSDHFRISVKREARGVASRHLHDFVEPGAALAARAPAGDFVLESASRPVVLLSAGVGVTPMVSMLHAVVNDATSRSVFFIHGARDGRHHPFQKEVARLNDLHANVKVHVAYSRPLPEDRIGIDFDQQGRIDEACLRSQLSDFDADYYVCGPLAFMSEIGAALETCGVPENAIHIESFGPMG